VFYFKRYLFIAILASLSYQLFFSADWSDAGVNGTRVAEMIRKRVFNDKSEFFCSLTPPDNANVINLAASRTSGDSDFIRNGRGFDYFDFSSRSMAIAQMYILEDRVLPNAPGNSNTSSFFDRLRVRFGDQVATGFFNINSDYIQITHSPRGNTDERAFILLPTSTESSIQWKRAISQSRKDCGYKSRPYKYSGQLILRTKAGDWFFVHSTGEGPYDDLNHGSNNYLNSERAIVYSSKKLISNGRTVLTEVAIDQFLIDLGARYKGFIKEPFYSRGTGLLQYDSNADLKLIKNSTIVEELKKL